MRRTHWARLAVGAVATGLAAVLLAGYVSLEHEDITQLGIVEIVRLEITAGTR